MTHPPKGKTVLLVGPNCPKCGPMKMKLVRAGIKFEVWDVFKHDMPQMARSLPQLYHDGKLVMIGYQPDKVDAWIRSNK